MSLTESIIEDAALTWFGVLGYSCLEAEALTRLLPWGEERCEALRQLNPAIPQARTLATLRDPLRRKPISGEVSVAETGNLIQTAY